MRDPLLRLRCRASTAMYVGQHGCRFGNGALTVKPLIACVITRAPVEGLRTLDAEKEAQLSSGDKLDALLSAHRAPLILPGSCFGPWSAQRLPTSCQVQCGSRAPISSACSDVCARQLRQLRRHRGPRPGGTSDDQRVARGRNLLLLKCDQVGPPVTELSITRDRNSVGGPRYRSV